MFGPFTCWQSPPIGVWGFGCLFLCAFGGIEGLIVPADHEALQGSFDEG